MGQLTRTLVGAHGRPSRCRAFSALFPRAHSSSLQLRKGEVVAARAAPSTRARGAQSCANAATARSAAFLGSFLAAASAPPRDLAEEGLAAAAGALYAKEGVDIEEGHVYSHTHTKNQLGVRGKRATYFLIGHH